MRPLTKPCKRPPDHAVAQGLGYYRIERDGKMVYLHRAVVEEERGPIPDEMQVDHLCRNRWCWEITHLEVVTQAENVLRGESLPAKNARKDRCEHGHDLRDPANVYVPPSQPTLRCCRACRVERPWAERLNCPICGTEFPARNCGRGRPQKTCSRECGIVHRTSSRKVGLR